MADKINLKSAIEQGKLDQFIKQHKGRKGDKRAFEATLRSMASGTPSEAPKASPQGEADD